MSDIDVMTGAETTARTFVAARHAARSLDDYPGRMPSTLVDAYRIQDAAIGLRGGRIAGWKVGRIQPPLDTQFGTSRLAGPIFADLVRPAMPTPDMPVFTNGFAAVEAEFLFRVGDVPGGRENWSVADALACVAAVHVGFEIASSPLADINRLGPTVTASDFGNNHGLVIGPEVTDWRDGIVDGMIVTTHIDSALAGTGQASSFPGGCGQSVAFLLENLTQRGIAIAPGTWVSTGAVSGVHQIAPGSTAVADFGGTYRIECRISAASPEPY